MIPSLLQIPSAVSDSKLHSVLPNNGKGDFQFDRSTGATRINRDGLIEEVGYFSSELVQNGNFSELGSEIITPEANSNFSSDTGYWTLETGVTIGNGKLNFTEAANNRSFYKGGLITVGKTYKLQITISGYVEGFIDSNNGNNFTFPSSNGTHTVYFVGGNPFLVLGANGTTTLSIDNVSVKQVDPNDRWIKGSGWSYGNNKILGSNTNTFDTIVQDISELSGKEVKLTFDIVDYTSGTFRLFPSDRQDGLDQRYSGNGSYQVIYTPTVNNLRFQQQNFVGAVTNISLVEIQGDRPRLSYDITNGVVEDKPHLLLENSSTNLVTFSEDFSQSAWVKENLSVIANQAISPDGGLNANKIIENNQNTFHLCLHTVTTSSSANYLWSVFVKKGTRTNAYIYFRTNGGSTRYGFNINLENGLITDTESYGSVTNVETNVVYYGNDWYRCSIRMGNTSGYISGIVAPNNNSTTNGINNEYQGDGTSYIYAWGAQLEQQSHATSYIKTAETTITRAAETCNNSKPSVNSTEGVLYAEIQALVHDNTRKAITISEGVSQAKRVLISYEGNSSVNARAFVYTGTLQCDFSISVSSVLEYNKIALVYKANDFKVYVNGSLVGSDTSGSTFSANTLNTLSFSDGNGTNNFYGKVKGLAVYNEALSESQLMQLTGVTASSIYNNFVTRTASFTVEALNEVKKVIDNL